MRPTVKRFGVKKTVPGRTVRKPRIVRHNSRVPIKGRAQKKMIAPKKMR